MASKYIQRHQIPNNFEVILADFVTEILRYQPQDIIDFGCQYFKCLEEQTVLDYANKGPNIPCDFKNVIPKIPQKKEPKPRVPRKKPKKLEEEIPESSSQPNKEEFHGTKTDKEEVLEFYLKNDEEQKAAEDKFKDFDWDQLYDKLPIRRNEEDKIKRLLIWNGPLEGKGKDLTLNELTEGMSAYLGLPEELISYEPYKKAKDAAKRLFKGKYEIDEDEKLNLIEFRFFLIFLRQYFNYWAMFERVDQSQNKKISLEEFKNAEELMKMFGVTIPDLEAEFKMIDTSGNGQIDFDEFCEYAIKKQLDLEDDDDFDDPDLPKK